MRARRSVPGWLTILVLLGTGFIIVSQTAASSVTAIGTQLFGPVEGGLARASDAVRQLVDTVSQAGALARQNEANQEQIARLQSEVVQMTELQLENQDLRQMLNLRASAPIGSMLSVNVIARDSLAIVQALTVDRGSDDGVTVDAPVITWRGIVGRVVEVHPKSSSVLLATDVNSAINARIQAEDSRATGIIRGTGDGRLVMQYVPGEDVLRVGDLAITSGIGGTFPAGLVIGQVIQVHKTDADVFQEALVQPAIDMRNLERLYILQQPSQATADALTGG